MKNKNIHQILILDNYGKESRDIIKYNKDIFKTILPKYKYHYWEQEDIISLLKDNFDTKVLDAFNSLKPYAYKSDLARLCILYVHGGWYIDVHTEAYSLPDPKEEYIVFRDRDFVTQSKNTISNSLMYFKSKNSLLMKCINKIIDNIDSRYYGNTPYSPTGPNLIGSIILEEETDIKKIVGYCTDLDNNKPSPTFGYYYYLSDGTKLGIAKNENSKFLDLPGYQNYRTMWEDKNIYSLPKKMKTIYINEYPAVYINMDHAIVNNKRMQKMLKDECGFTDIKRIKGEVGKDKVFGTSISHHKSMCKTQVPVVIFEDDCQTLKYINKIDVPEDADAIYLGVMPWGMENNEALFNKIDYQKVDGTDDVYKIYNMLGAHSILYLTEKFFNATKSDAERAIKTGEAQDIYKGLSQKDFNVYAIGTPMFYQTGYYEQQTNKHISEYIKYSHDDLTKDFKGTWTLR